MNAECFQDSDNYMRYLEEVERENRVSTKMDFEFGVRCKPANCAPPAESRFRIENCDFGGAMECVNAARGEDGPK